MPTEAVLTRRFAEWSSEKLQIGDYINVSLAKDAGHSLPSMERWLNNPDFNKTKPSIYKLVWTEGYFEAIYDNPLFINSLRINECFTVDYLTELFSLWARHTKEKQNKTVRNHYDAMFALTKNGFRKLRLDFICGKVEPEELHQKAKGVLNRSLDVERRWRLGGGDLNNYL